MNIETKLWKLISANGSFVMVIQKASGKMRMVSRGKLPSDEDLGMMHERTFDNAARKAFHD